MLVRLFLSVCYTRKRQASPHLHMKIWPRFGPVSLPVCPLLRHLAHSAVFSLLTLATNASIFGKTIRPNLHNIVKNPLGLFSLLFPISRVYITSHLDKYSPPVNNLQCLLRLPFLTRLDLLHSIKGETKKLHSLVFTR
jgi:hypothetical protein